MNRHPIIVGLLALGLAGPAVAAGTNPVPGEGPILVPPKVAYVDPALRPVATAEAATVRPAADLRDAVRVAARWGRVTSTWRSAAHNARVGGVPNSFHLSGRAIDIARRPGVSHAQVAAALRAAGMVLIESLDEGDHSHFAFARPGEEVPPVKLAPERPLVQLANVEEDGRLRLRLVLPTASGGGQ